MFALPIHNLYPEDFDKQIARFLDDEIDSFNDYHYGHVDHTVIVEDGFEVDDLVIHEPTGTVAEVFSNKSYLAPANATEPWYEIVTEDGQFWTVPQSELM